jgi:hypothetical protein
MKQVVPNLGDASFDPTQDEPATDAGGDATQADRPETLAVVQDYRRLGCRRKRSPNRATHKWLRTTGNVQTDPFAWS